MPKAIKKKVTKKGGLKEEEVRSAAGRLREIIKEKKRILIIILLALGIAIMPTIFFMLYSSSMRREAYALERIAYNYYYEINQKTSLTDEERWTKALEFFQKAIEVKSTATAQFYTGNCFFNLGDYENAIKAYNKFIDKYKNKEVMLPLVYQKLASAYIKKGKNEEAIKTLKILAQFKNGAYEDSALILEARYYETTGKHEDALKKYKELLEGFPSSPWAGEAKARIETEESNKNKIPDELDKDNLTLENQSKK